MELARGPWFCGRVGHAALTAASLLFTTNVFADEPPRRTVVAAMGDCRDPELLGAVTALNRALEARPELHVVLQQDVQSKLGVGQTQSVEEIQRQIELAQQQFYGARFHKAVPQIRNALAAIERLPPGSTRWQLYTSARSIEGLIYTRHSREGSSDDAFRAILRLDPTFQLDRDYFGPSTQKILERVRKDLSKKRGVSVSVVTVPAGAQVFLDGKAVGKTPLTTQLDQGRYQLEVGTEGRYSIPRTIDVDSHQEHRIDLQFESSIEAVRALCLRVSGGEKERLDSAVKMGSVIDADDVVLVRFERPQLGATWLAGTLVDVRGGQKVREGGLQVGPAGVSERGFSDLARFVATGEMGPDVRVPPSAESRASASPSTVSPAVASLDPATQDVQPPRASTMNDAATLTEPLHAPADRRWRRPASYVAFGAATAALLGAGYFQYDAVQGRKAFDDWRDRGSPPGEAGEADQNLTRAESGQVLAITGIGIAAAAAGTGAFLLLTSGDAPPESGARVTVVPIGRGAALSFTAPW